MTTLYKRILFLIVCNIFTFYVFSQQGGKTPVMGWASWNQYGFNINEATFKNQADAMVSSGLQAVGFQYINVDDGFFDGRDGDGTLLIDPIKFPNGMKAVADYIHSKGLKAGFYSDAGASSCGGLYNGQTGGVDGGLYNHDQQDCDLVFKTWGFDFYKVDYCGGIVLNLDEETRYTAIRDAIVNTGRDVNYNTCRWLFPGPWITEVANSWRVSADINTAPGSLPVWSRIMDNLDLNTYLAAYCSAGHYNDMDMLEVGRGLPFEEDKSHFSLWCIMSSPLLLGNDLTQMSNQTKTILTNTEVIAVNQDTTALQAHLISEDGDGLQVWAKNLNGRQSLERAVLLFNRSETTATMSVQWSDLDLVEEATVRDLWSHTDLGSFPTGYSTSVPSHGVVMLKVVGTKAIVQEVFEAEYAWLNNYNHIKNNSVIANQARAAKDAICSRGAKASYIGNNVDNYLEYSHVYSKVAGEYTLTISYLSGENRDVTVGVNGVNQNLTGLNSGGFGTIKDVTLLVNLEKGYNTIRLSNSSGYAPDIDKIHLDLNKDLADVSVTVEADKENYEIGESATLSASATIVGGTITKVSFYNSNELLGEDASEPYLFQWEGLTEGTYSITAMVTDNAGIETSSAPVSIRVVVPQGPYEGSAATIPGKIELENYDVGGNGFAYYDTDAGSNVDPAPDFRTDEDVDIETCADTGGGYNLGWTVAGEWLEYTVNVAKTGTYTLTIRVACDGDGKTISLSTNGTALVNDIAIPNTGGWQEWTNVIIENMELTAGTQILRLTIGESDFVNLNYLVFDGEIITPDPIQLTVGWNLIGCSLEGSTDLQTAFSNVWDNVISIKDMNNFYLKDQPEFLNSLKTISWGYGYLVKVDQDCELSW
jgi:hypothetical protein